VKIPTQSFTQFSQKIQDNIAKVVIGKADVTEMLLVALLVEGHVLLEDVPGIGKTTLARAMSRSLDASFARIQFTPDLLPSDVTGLNIYNQKDQNFEFRSGPVMNQIVLADEINRATPRTQSSLLEAMQEGQVTVDGITHPLPRPFMVIATQNPIELEGTFPLPEAQIDRFLMRLQLGYPNKSEEEKILLNYQRNDPLTALQSVVAAAKVLTLQQQVKEIHINPDVRNYILEVVRATKGVRYPRRRAISLPAYPHPSPQRQPPNSPAWTHAGTGGGRNYEISAGAGGGIKQFKMKNVKFCIKRLSNYSGSGTTHLINCFLVQITTQYRQNLHLQGAS